jgi:hypothetical protein
VSSASSNWKVKREKTEIVMIDTNLVALCKLEKISLTGKMVIEESVASKNRWGLWGKGRKVETDQTRLPQKIHKNLSWKG